MWSVVRSTPRIQASPDVTGKRPAQALSRLVLPAPLAPTTRTTSPVWRERSTPARAGKRPARATAARNWTTGAMDFGTMVGGPGTAVPSGSGSGLGGSGARWVDFGLRQPMASVLLPLPSLDFDPTEVAVSWSVLRERGHDVVFATPDGRPARADELMVSGRGLDPWGALPASAASPSSGASCGPTPTAAGPGRRSSATPASSRRCAGTRCRGGAGAGAGAGVRRASCSPGVTGPGACGRIWRVPSSSAPWWSSSRRASRWEPCATACWWPPAASTRPPGPRSCGAAAPPH